MSNSARDEGSTWEERMAARAKARREAEPPVPDAYDGPHAEHHMHVQGSMTRCSCGGIGGVFSVALPSDPAELAAIDKMWADAVCSRCGERGVMLSEDFFRG